MTVNKTKAFPLRTVKVAAGLTDKAGRAAVVKAALRKFGGDYRGATYSPKTGKGSVR